MWQRDALLPCCLVSHQLLLVWHSCATSLDDMLRTSASHSPLYMHSTPAPPPPALQTEVENFYISNGLLFPTYTPNYWFGAKTTYDLWPTFYWLQRSIPGPDNRNYVHWGLGRQPEPNNLAGNEYCAACNLTLAYQTAWGWSDAACSLPMPYMCRLMDNSAMGTLAYQAPKTNVTWTVNMQPMTQEDAQAFCNAQGSHLAYFTSLAEQVGARAVCGWWWPCPTPQCTCPAGASMQTPAAITLTPHPPSCPCRRRSSSGLSARA